MTKSYHSRILSISHKLDKVIEKLKSSYIDLKTQPPWWAWLLAAPLRDIKKIIELKNGIVTFLKSKALVSILPVLMAFFGTFVNLHVSAPGWLLPLLGFIVGYLICIVSYFPTLTQFNSPHFHLGAYKALRKQEYELFHGAFLDAEGEFYFKGVYDYVTNSQEGYQLIEGVIHNFLANEKADYKAKILSLEETIQEINSGVEKITADYDQFTKNLINERDELHEEFEFVISLLKDLNTLLFRIHNKGLKLNDLDLLTGYTLYELRENKLVQIADVRTSGSTVEEIPLNEPKYAHYGAVKVINDNLNIPYFNHPYPGHMVVSFKMRMDQIGTWVYNFHFDDSNKTAWKLLIENGIIESKEIYRLIHALCLLSLDYNVKSEEGAVGQ